MSQLLPVDGEIGKAVLVRILTGWIHRLQHEYIKHTRYLVPGTSNIQALTAVGAFVDQLCRFPSSFAAPAMRAYVLAQK